MASAENEEHEYNNDEEHDEESEEHAENDVEENENENEEEQEENEENEEEQEEHENEEQNDEEHEEEEGEEEAEHNDEDNEEKTKNDNDSDEEFVGFGEEEINANKRIKNRQILSESDEENSSSREKINKKKSKKHKEHKNKKVKNDSDEEEEEQEQVEHEGEEEEDDEEIKAAQSSKRSHSDSDSNDKPDSEEVPVKKKRQDKESDVDKLLKKNQAEKRRRNRKKGDSEELNEMDNTISAIIAEMKNVAAEDRAANEKSLTTLQKIKMLSTVVNMLQKSEHHAAMIELGVLGAIAEWLAPLPDRSLPNISIRNHLIDALRDFGEINVDYLKSSGVGKAVMFLYKHSKETKENKQKLEKLINNWARPIFNLDSNFKQLTKEERQERDLQHIKQLNKRSSNEFNQNQSVDDILNTSYSRKKTKSDNDKSSDEPKKVLRPGDPGFIPRARVPAPSSKDYVIRPKSNVDALELSDKKFKKSESRLDKHKKRFLEIKKNAKSNRAVTMVAAGGK